MTDEPESPTGPADPGGRAQKSVLVVDDDPVQTIFLRAMLEPAGWRVAAANGVDEARHILGRQVPDVVVTDVVMPGVSGYDFCKEIKSSAHTAHVPVVLLTQLQSPEDVIRGLECGADNFLVKPCEAACLLQRLEQTTLGRTAESQPDRQHIISGYLDAALDELLRVRELEREFRKKENALQESLYLLEGTLDSLIGSVSILDATGRILAANLAWRKGQSHEPFLGGEAGPGDDYCQACLESSCVPPDTAGKLVAGIHRVMAGQVHQYEMEYATLADERFLAHVTSFGPPPGVHVVVAHQSVTPLRRAQENEKKMRLLAETHLETARHLARQNQLILESIQEGLCQVDRLGRVDFINPSGARMLGIDPDAVRGLPAHEVFRGAEAGKGPFLDEKNPLISIVRGGRATPVSEAFFRKSDGTTFPAEVSGSPLIEDGTVQGGVLVFRDITTRHELEEQLRQAQRLEVVGRLAGGIAHDFNNLLSVILGSCDLLLMQQNMEGDEAQWMQDIQEAAHEAQSLTQKLLLFSRKGVVQPKVHDLADVVRRLEPRLEQLLGERVGLHIDLADRSCLVRADRTHLEQVLINLAVNAREAMPCGGTFTLRVTRQDGPTVDGSGSREKGPNSVVIEISDTGRGMDQQVREHVFEPFFTTKGSEQGAGLGLSTVYGIIQQLAGKIRVDSETGQGTTFWITLPRVADELDAPPAPSATGEAGAHSGPSPVILLVDADDCVRKVTTMMLESSGFAVVEARSAAEALARLRGTATVDLMIADLSTVPQDQGGPVDEIRALQPRLKLMYLSALGPSSCGGASSVPVEVLQKPLSIKSLAESVKKALGQ